MQEAGLPFVSGTPAIKVGVVEDELIIADSIRAILTGMNYTVPEPCCEYEEAIAMLHHEKPDLVLLDINLAGHLQDGIAIARYIREHLNMPYIFLTANSDPGTLARAKAVTPNAFLVKPFLKEDLYAAIEIAVHNFYSAAHPAPAGNAKDYLLLKEGNVLHKVRMDDILYLESEHVYVNVYTAARKYLIRATLQQYADELDAAVFIRIHRSYIVHKHRIEQVGFTHLHIGDKELPVSRKYRDAVLAQL